MRRPAGRGACNVTLLAGSAPARGKARYGMPKALHAQAPRSGTPSPVPWTNARHRAARARRPPQALKAANLPKSMKSMKGGDMQMNPRQMQQSLANMSRALPPQLLKQIGGAQGLQSLMKGLEGKGMGGLGGLAGLGGK